MPPCEQFFVWFSLVLLLCHKSLAIDCYQCSGSDSNQPFQCNEWLSSDLHIKPESCDTVYGAKYCVKHIGRYEAWCIECFQCSSSNTLDCSDGMIQMSDLKPQNCDHVFEAAYCIKSTSLAGGIGAKRFCSSLDLGNYCNYVKQPGDSLTYRTCVFTCSGHGCNPSNMNKPKMMSLYLGLLVSVLIYFNR